MGDIIEELIKNAHMIFNIYQKIKETKNKDGQEFKDLFLGLDITDLFLKIERKNLFSDLELFIKKEEKLLNDLTNYYGMYIFDIVTKYRLMYGLDDVDFISNYILTSKNSLPILRIFEKLKEIMRNTPKAINAYEDGDLVFKDDIEEKIEYFSKDEYISSEIYDDLMLEIIVRFLNKSQKVNEESLTDRIESIPYELAYLVEPLEKMFLNEHILNVSYRLFLTENEHFKDFDSLSLKKSIENLSLEMLEKHLNCLIEKRITNTTEKALLESILISSLLDILDEDIKNDFYANYREKIEKISYELALINEIKENERNVTVLKVNIDDVKVIEVREDEESYSRKRKRKKRR